MTASKIEAAAPCFSQDGGEETAGFFLHEDRQLC